MRSVVRPVVGLALAVVAVLAIAGCAPAGAADATPVATSAVDLPPSYRFAPAAITVKAGTTVTFTNNDNFPHTVQLLDPTPDTPRPLDLGKSVTITFSTPGLVHYQCSLHPQNMQGTVLVTS
jgi:plastocyanin